MPVTPIDITVPVGATDEHIQRLRAKAAFFRVHGYEPHEYQWQLIHAPFERFLTQCWPRQHGKSTGAAWEILYECAESKNKHVWLVAPTYDLCFPIFDVIEQAALEKCTYDEFKPTKLSRRDLYVHWSNGSKIECKSAENEKSLQGRRLDRLFIEEAASINDGRIYDQYLRPTLAVSRSGLVAISTPKGFNWFFDLAQKGMDPFQKDYFFGHAPLGCSPYITSEEIEEARHSLPQRVFQQEWEAEFVSDAGAVFRGVKECIIEDYTQNVGPEEGHFYAGGIDLAKHEDYSVITIIDRLRKRQVYFDRFTEVDWHRQIPMFAHVCKTYGDCPVLLDSTGVGEPIYEFCRELGMRVYPYNFSGNRKEDLINRLALAIEKQEVGLMDIPEQTNELIGYEYRRTKAGRLTMSAPGRHYDDIVIALALAVWQALQGTGQVKTLSRGWRM